ncbi:MAG: DUF1684 domain-containing protein [Pseudomonadota bacterium]
MTTATAPTSAPRPGGYPGAGRLALADWRRRMAALYAEVRALAVQNPEAAWMHWRGVRSALFREHPMSPLPRRARQGFGEIDCYPYDPALRLAAGVAALHGPSETADLDTDGVMTRRAIGRTDGLSDHLGAELTVFWIEGYGGGIFLPLLDGTSGRESYGGGRYLLDGVKGADLGADGDGRLILDFNFAYVPSCAVNPAYTCPLAPPENRLPMTLRAGERLGA